MKISDEQVLLGRFGNVPRITEAGRRSTLAAVSGNG
jgi:hypothetical protein